MKSKSSNKSVGPTKDKPESSIKESDQVESSKDDVSPMGGKLSLASDTKDDKEKSPSKSVRDEKAVPDIEPKGESLSIMTNKSSFIMLTSFQNRKRLRKLMLKINKRANQ